MAQGSWRTLLVLKQAGAGNNILRKNKRLDTLNKTAPLRTFDGG